ncbi:MAG TPA: presenilin family intramembrane aspartyl protease PSH [Thermoplasmata archaeon]|nr:presenilin family intramembrane aspartyl protease PSH [Thermoplasmata archaeon]
MRREYAATAAMGATLAASQFVAIGISPSFKASGFQAFPNEADPVNAVLYIAMILVFTGVILAFVKFRRQELARYVILASVFLTLAFVLLLPLYFGLWYAYFAFHDASDPATVIRISETLGNLATVYSFSLAGLLVFALVKHPEWYVVDGIGLAVAAGVTAILGVSFAILPALLLLLGLALYDAWAVYRTKHMVTLADALTSQKLPVLLVIPKRAHYSLRNQKGLKEQLESGEEREAMFIGLGDLIIPGVLSVSAFNFLDPLTGAAAGVAPNAAVALGTVLGSLAGFAVLMRFVLTGNPQAGLPLLNGGAAAGFFLAHLLVYGSLVPVLL